MTKNQELFNIHVIPLFFVKFNGEPKKQKIKFPSILAATHVLLWPCINLISEHKNLSKNICKFFFLNSNFASFSASNVQIYTKLDFETQSVKKINR